MAGGYAPDQLTEAVNDLGLTRRNGVPLSRAQYHRSPQNPIYYGDHTV